MTAHIVICSYSSSHRLSTATLPLSCSAAAHVPLDVYSSNLVAIVQQLQAAGVHNILLVTPPPVNEAAPGAILPGEVRFNGRG
jgi:hypothetical protein